VQERLLGRTGTFVSELCLGTMTFAREADEATSAKLLDRYLLRGRRCR
jgi:aryl-alcohol dehydrogenase-like predicted oxidoreductase